MNLKIKLFVCIIYSTFCFAQFSEFKYKREIKGVDKQWHAIDLPEDIFAKGNPDFSDFRIFGLTNQNDTIEVPYVIQIAEETTAYNKLPFKTINNSNNQNNYFYTFEIDKPKVINTIDLDFKQDNFDWKLNLEGSQNLEQWVTIVEDYRIISIKNEFEDFKFTKLSFQDSNFKYYRLTINSKTNPELSEASLFEMVKTKGSFINYPIKKLSIKNDKTNKQSLLDIELGFTVPVSNLDIFIKDTFDYFRPFTIEYVSDSIQTDKGTKFIYRTLYNGNLNSIEKSNYDFDNVRVKKIKIIVDNYNNTPLKFDSIQVKGNLHKLIARFPNTGKYYLAYGNAMSEQPYYDIQRFLDKIPEVGLVSLGTEEIIDNPKVIEKNIQPIFQNKLWLWAIMIFIIALLGFASYKMLKK